MELFKKKEDIQQMAFPMFGQFPGKLAGELNIVMQSGMTLRDYFAAQAMQLTLKGASEYMTTNDLAWISEQSYNIADAMLKAREL